MGILNESGWSPRELETKPKPSIDRLLTFLSEEIRDLENAMKRPGWTTWALTGALATLVWVFLTELEKSGVNGPTFLLLFLFGVVSCDFIWVFWKTLFSTSTNEEKLRFDYANMVLKDIGKHVFPLLLRNVTLFYFIAIAPLPYFYKTTAIIFFAIETATFLLTLVLGCLRLPIAREPPLRFKWVLVGSWLTLGLTTNIGLLITLYQMDSTPTIADWKIALIANGVIFLVVFLVRISGEPPLLGELKAIRKRLLLGKVTPEAAAKQIDLVQHGLTLRDVLQPRISRVLSLHNELVTLLDSLQIDLDTLMKIVINPPLRLDLTEHTQAIIKALLLSVDQKITNMSQIQEKLHSARLALGNQVLFLRRTSPEAAKEIERILEELKPSVERVDRRIEDFHKLIRELKRKIEFLLANIEIS